MEGGARMKLFYKCNLPDFVKYNSRIYRNNRELTNQVRDPFTFQIKHTGLSDSLKGHKVILVHVLARNLRGKTDLHGNLYKGSTWVFTAQNE